MIKINLIGGPRRKKTRKGFEVQSQLVLGFAGFFIFILVLGYVSILLSERISSLEDQKTKLTRELEVLKKQVQEVENYEKNKKIFEEKIRIIQQLRNNQSGPVHLLDEVSRRLPDRVWLLNLTEQGGTVDLEGKAITNSEIVDFINRLKQSAYFGDIQLIESRQSADNGIPIYIFKLRWQRSMLEAAR
jgi:type IV pilus assembly protein PilN